VRARFRGRASNLICAIENGEPAGLARFRRGGTRTIAEIQANIDICAERGTESGTVFPDPKLTAVIELWSRLPEHARQTICSIAQTWVERGN
jgi:hypothetical protein